MPKKKCLMRPPEPKLTATPSNLARTQIPPRTARRHLILPLAAQPLTRLKRPRNPWLKNGPKFHRQARLPSTREVEPELPYLSEHSSLYASDNARRAARSVTPTTPRLRRNVRKRTETKWNSVRRGLGGWDKNAYATQGDDALGGWGGSHITGASSATAGSGTAKFAAVATSEVPSRSNSPDSHRPAPSPWTGGNQGGMIHNAHNAYNGGYSQANNIPHSPNFPLASQGSFHGQGAFPNPNAGFRGSQHGGYQRF